MMFRDICLKDVDSMILLGDGFLFISNQSAEDLFRGKQSRKNKLFLVKNKSEKVFSKTKKF